jgi:hypothetical protein
LLFHSFQRAYRRESLSGCGTRDGRSLRLSLDPCDRRIRLARKVVEDVTEQPQDEALDERYGRPDDGLGREPKLRPKAHARPAPDAFAAKHVRVVEMVGPPKVADAAAGVQAVSRIKAPRDRSSDDSGDGP